MEQSEQASTAISEYHDLYNSGDDDRIWMQFGSEFKTVTSREDFDRLVETVREALGKVEDSKQIGINFQTNTNGRSTVVTMGTTFENGSAQEVFTFFGSGDEQRLVGWNVNSDQLMAYLMERAAEQRALEEPNSAD